MPRYRIEQLFADGHVETTTRETDVLLHKWDSWEEPGQSEQWHVVEVSHSEPLTYAVVAPIALGLHPVERSGGGAPTRRI